MSHEELRDLLHRVVPEAPDPAPASLASAGRSSRARRRAGVVVGVAVAVAVVATTAGLLGGSDTDPRPDTVATPSPDPTPDPAPRPTTTEPYDANVCPATIPASFENPREVDLGDVVSISHCSTLLDRPGPSEPLTPEAFVDDMEVFVAAARDNPMTRRACLFISYRPSGVVVFEMADGTTTAVFPDCERLRIGAERPVNLSLTRVFQDALDAQRDRLEYRTRVDRTSCAGGAAAAPVRPGREDLVAALYCSGDGTLRAPLDEAQLSTLRAAWEAAAPMSDDEVSRCYSNGDAGPYLLTTTDRGDAVSLVTSTCGHLVLDSASLGPQRLSVSPEELGLG